MFTVKQMNKYSPGHTQQSKNNIDLP